MDKTKNLKFIHITKTAGTSIEDSGIKNNLSWGRFHVEYGDWHEFFPNKSNELKYDWFTVVRNPYERILSEYYCKYGGIGGKNIWHTYNDMDAYLIDKIKNRKKSGDHYSEQYKYLPNDPNIIVHVLKFENLEEEFSSLLDQYNITHFTLSKENARMKANFSLPFTVDHFSHELMELINKVYANDFEIFLATQK